LIATIEGDMIVNKTRRNREATREAITRKSINEHKRKRIKTRKSRRIWRKRPNQQLKKRDWKL
uniref:50S ribosomal protein L23 n=1 Tax=Toxocara canis TaxID=6265 RepID=A0A183VH78_TOXCA